MKNFGDFLKSKRTAQGITLRKMAESLEISAPFYSDVEKNRRNPLSIDKLNKVAKLLSLSEADKAEMMDLAGKDRNTIAPDLPEYIIDRNYVSAALRMAKNVNASKDDWEKFVAELKKKEK